MLKYKIDQAVFDLLSDAEKTFYKQDGEIFILQVEGAVDKSKVDEFRNSNIIANIKLEEIELKYKGIDMDKINNLLAQESKLQDIEFIKAKDFDGLVLSKTKAITTDFEAKMANLTAENELLKTSNNSIVSKYEIEGAITKAFGHHKIAPDAFDAVTAQVKNKFSINNGVVVAMAGENIELGVDGNLTVDEFIGSMPEIFKIQSSGGQANGNQLSNMPNQSTTSRQKITSGLNKLMGVS